MAEGGEPIGQIDNNENSDDWKGQILDYQNVKNSSKDNSKSPWVDEQPGGRETTSKNKQDQVSTPSEMGARIIQDAWNKMSVKIRCQSEGKLSVVPIEIEAYPFQMQYLVHFINDVLQSLAKNVGCTFSNTYDEIVFSCEASSFLSIVGKLREGLQSAILKIGHKPLQIRKKHEQKFLTCLSENVPEAVASNKAVIFRIVDKYENFVLVGESHLLEDCLKAVNKLISNVKREADSLRKCQITLVKAEVESFERLNMLQKLQRKFENGVKIIFDGNATVVIEYTAEDIGRKCEKELDCMLRSIRTKMVDLKFEHSKVLTSPRCQEIITQQMELAGIECVTRVTTSCVHLYALDDEMLQKGETLIMKCTSATKYEKKELEQKAKLIADIILRFEGQVFYLDDEKYRSFLGVPEAIGSIDKMIRETKMKVEMPTVANEEKIPLQDGEDGRTSEMETKEKVPPSSNDFAQSVKLNSGGQHSDEKQLQKDGKQSERTDLEDKDKTNEIKSHSSQNQGKQLEETRPKDDSIGRAVSLVNKENENEHMKKGTVKETEENLSEDNRIQKMKADVADAESEKQCKGGKDVLVNGRKQGEQSLFRDEGNYVSGKAGDTNTIVAKTVEEISTGKISNSENQSQTGKTEDDHTVGSGEGNLKEVNPLADTERKEEFSHTGEIQDAAKTNSDPKIKKHQNKSNSIHTGTPQLGSIVASDQRKMSKSYDERSTRLNHEIFKQDNFSQGEPVDKRFKQGDDRKSQLSSSSSGDKWDLALKNVNEEKICGERSMKEELTITVTGDQRTIKSGSYAAFGSIGAPSNTHIGHSNAGLEISESLNSPEEHDVFVIPPLTKDIGTDDVSHIVNDDCAAHNTRSKKKESSRREVQESAEGAQYELQLTMEKHFLEFLQKNKSREMETIMEMENVKVDYYPDVMILKGGRDNLHRARRKVRDIECSLHTEELDVDIPANLITEKDSAIVKQNVAEVISTNMQVDFDGLDDKEPEYYFSWSSEKSPVCLILTYGKVENTKADAIVLPCHKDFRPRGSRSQSIVKKGGKQVLMDSASELKKNRKIISNLQIQISEQTGKLDCLALVYANIPLWSNRSDIDANGINKMSLSLMKLMNEEKLRRLVIPLDVADDFCFTAFGSLLAYSLWSSGRKELGHRIEIHLCVTSVKRAEMVWRECSRSITGEEDETIHKIMHYVPLSNGNENTVKGKINVSILQDELVKVDNKVDVIVNSTNTDLILKQGHVSCSLLKTAGHGIQSECKEKGPVNVGDVISTSAGKMKCKKLFHGVLLPFWIPTGNFSLQVMSAMMRKCLCRAEINGYSSLAFPALGTGKLQYPWNKVAETMFEVIDEYNSLVPNTCIRDVFFVLYPKDLDAIEAFEFKEEARSRRKNKSVFQGSMDTITYLETRIPEHGYRIQVLSEKSRDALPEKPEVEVKFEKQIDDHQQESYRFDNDPTRDLYTISMKVGSKKDSKKGSLQEAVRLTNEKRFVTAAFYISHFSEDKAIATRVENLKKVILNTLHPPERRNSQSSAASSDSKIFLRRFIFILSETHFEKLETKWAKTNLLSRIKWPHAKDWNVMGRSFGQCLVLRMTSSDMSLINDMSAQVVRMIETLKIILVEWKSGSWFLLVTGRERRNPLDQFTAQRLEWAYRLKWNSIQIENSNGQLWVYDLMNRRVYQKSGQQQNLIGSLINEKDNDIDAPSQTVPEPVRKSPPVFPGKAVRQDREHEDRGSPANRDSMAEMEKTNVQKEDAAEATSMKIFETLKADINPGLQHFGEIKLKESLSDVGELSLETKDAQVSLQASSVSSLEEAKDKLASLALDDTVQESSIDRSYHEKPQKTEEVIDCQHIDYDAFRHFAQKELWFKDVANHVVWNRNEITLSGKAKQYEKEIKEYLKKIMDMEKTVIEFNSDELDKYDIVSKEIKEIFLNEFIYDFKSGHKIFLISDSYETKTRFKHKGDVLLGRVKVTQVRRQRKFDNASQEPGGVSHANLDDKQKSSSRRERMFNLTDTKDFSTSQLSSDDSSLSFTTQEGIHVKVYSASITRLSVDCIVNAANEDLMHGGGVAYAISNAAGYQFDIESRNYVKNHGSLKVGTCCSTGAHDLPYKCVIHTVGPRWNDYLHSEKWQCENDLQQAVEVTFTEAVNQGCETVALPAISSGIFGVPWEVCVKQYYQAVVAYSQTATNRVKEIHFVDKDRRMVDFISSKFREYSKGNLPQTDLKGNGATTVMQKKDEKVSSTTGASKWSDTVRKTVTKDDKVSDPVDGLVVFDVDSGISLRVGVGDLIKLDVEAIVCPQDVKFRSYGSVAKAIMHVANEVHEIGEKEKLSEGFVDNVKVLKASLAVNWKYIFHAVPPRWKSNTSGTFDYDLGRTFNHILCEAQEHNVRSIAIPLLGFGNEGFNIVVDKNWHLLSKELVDFSKYRRKKDYNLDVHMVCQQNDILLKLMKGFGGKFKKAEQSDIGKKPASQTSSTKGMMEPVHLKTSEENCPICMDNYTEPQKLTKCGHIFCLECIQEYFIKCKPSCPNCGVIYGKVTGDQPHGSVKFEREGTRLPGYDRYGCIKVTYTFPGGKQGPDHPSPGTPYKGISRSGHLPDNTEGRLAAKLLNVAFTRKLVFTIGRSRTTGEEGVLTWNDIHHKTRIYGGTDRFGYPDPTYIERVMEEMAVKGVTEESADDPSEYTEYSKVFYK